MGRYWRDPQGGSQHGCRRGVALWLHYPAFFYRHTNCYLYILTFNFQLSLLRLYIVSALSAAVAAACGIV